MKISAFAVLSMALVLSVRVSAAPASTVEVTAPESPYGFKPLKMFVFPDKDFPITRYGARPDDVTANTRAFARAMEACNKAGGGRVVVPAGRWKTGPVHFKSNCELHFEDGGVIVSSDNPELYLPAVQTSWEGMECMNYSPLVYAFGCENVAITGNGGFEPEMGTWIEWFGRPASHMAASRMLYAMAATDVPVHHRDMVEMNATMRPQLIQFNRCRNVQLADFHIRYSPFWTMHLLLCKDVWVHGVDNYAHGHNPDGLDIEMTQHVLVENCRFNQGDDAVCLKAGRNRDAWRLATPTEDVVVRNCHTECGGGVVVIGSEMSGDVRRVYVHDCTARYIYRVLNIKTNERRGGVVEDVTVENVRVENVQEVMAIRTDAMFQWKDMVPTFEVRPSVIRNITLRNVEADRADCMYNLNGDARQPVTGVTIENVRVGVSGSAPCHVSNVDNLVMSGLESWSSVPEKNPVLKIVRDYRANQKLGNSGH